MNKNRGKRTKEKKNQEKTVVKINGKVGNLLDHVKQAIYFNGLDFETIYRLMKEKVTTGELEKLGQNLKRVLVNNISFYYKENTWFLDNRGNSNNNKFYQYLATLGRPANFRELLEFAKENNQPIAEIREQDFVYDGRFIRLKNGKWGLTHWQVIWEVNQEEINQIIRLIQKEQKPINSKILARKVLGADVIDTNLDWIMAKDVRFVQINGDWFLSSIIEHILEEVSAIDEFAFIRENEINVLQEAELMLIIGEADATKRQYILSSLDLERGVIRLSKRMSELFKKLPKISYLKLVNGEAENEGLWYFKEHNFLAGLKPWFEKKELVPGSKIDMSFTAKNLKLELKIGGEREAEVYAEGLKMKKLKNLKDTPISSFLIPEEVIAEILQLYPEGLKDEKLIPLVKLILDLEEEDLFNILEEHFYYEKNREGNWNCNFTMRQAYLGWQKEREELLALLGDVNREVAVTAEDFDNLHEQKVVIEDELLYLREHHRKEEALFQARIEELSAMNEQLTVENNRLNNENALLEGKEKEHLEHIEYQSSQVVNLRKDRNKFKVKLEQVENRAMQLQSSLNYLMEETHTELERLKREVLEKEHQLDSLQYANQELQKNLARLHDERRQLKRKYSSWPVRIAIFLSGFKGEKKSFGG